MCRLGTGTGKVCYRNLKTNGVQRIRNDVRFADYTLHYKQIVIISVTNPTKLLRYQGFGTTKDEFEFQIKIFFTIDTGAILSVCDLGNLYTKIFIYYYDLSKGNYFASNRYFNRLSS